MEIAKSLGSNVAFILVEKGDCEKRELGDNTDDFCRSNVLFEYPLGVYKGLPYFPYPIGIVRGGGRHFSISLPIAKESSMFFGEGAKIFFLFRETIFVLVLNPGILYVKFLS